MFGLRPAPANGSVWIAGLNCYASLACTGKARAGRRRQHQQSGRPLSGLRASSFVSAPVPARAEFEHGWAAGVRGRAGKRQVVCGEWRVAPIVGAPLERLACSFWGQRAAGLK